VFGSGEQRRPLLHVRDAARALIWAWQREARAGEVFNIVADNPRIASIAQQLADLRPGTRLHYTDQDYREQLSLSIDGTAARAAGFSPSEPWPEALLALLGHFRGLGGSAEPALK
jgi:nucleoside-diphosphate-sugar epimerase